MRSANASAVSGWLQNFEWKTVLLFVASLVLSGASFYTTFYGMIEFMGIWPVAAAITFAVQALLFVISWWLARNWFLGVKPLVMGTGIFLLCAAISVFFSFASLFGFIDGGRTKDATVKRAQTQVSGILNDIQGRLDGDLGLRHDGLVDGLVRDPSTGVWTKPAEDTAYTGWRTELLQYLQAAERAPDAYRTAQNRKRDDLLDQKTDLVTQIAGLRQNLARLERGTETREDLVRDLRRQVEAEQTRLRSVETRVTEGEARLLDLAARRRAEEVTGKGPKWRDLNIEYGEQEALLSALPDQVERIEARLADLRDRLATAATASDADAKANIERELPKLTATLGEVEKALGVVQDEASLDVTDRTNLIREKLRQFENQRDYAAFRDLVISCTETREALKDIASQTGLTQGFRCDNQRIGTAVAALDDRAQEIAAYRRGCVGSEVFSAAPVFEEIIKTGETCIARSQLPQAETADFSESLFQLGNTGGDRAHNFALAQAALVRDANPLAFLALIIAIAIDCLVLLCAFIGTSTMAPVEDDVIRFLSLPMKPHDPAQRPPPGADDDVSTLVEGCIEQPGNRSEIACFDRVAKWLLPHDLATWNTQVAHGTRELILKRGARKALQDLISVGNRSGSSRVRQTAEGTQAGSSRVRVIRDRARGISS